MKNYSIVLRNTLEINGSSILRSFFLERIASLAILANTFAGNSEHLSREGLSLALERGFPHFDSAAIGLVVDMMKVHAPLSREFKAIITSAGDGSSDLKVKIILYAGGIERKGPKIFEANFLFVCKKELIQLAG